MGGPGRSCACWNGNRCLPLQFGCRDFCSFPHKLRKAYDLRKSFSDKRFIIEFRVDAGFTGRFLTLRLSQECAKQKVCQCKSIMTARQISARSRYQRPKQMERDHKPYYSCGNTCRKNTIFKNNFLFFICIFYTIPTVCLTCARTGEEKFHKGFLPDLLAEAKSKLSVL